MKLDWKQIAVITTVIMVLSAFIVVPTVTAMDGWRGGWRGGWGGGWGWNKPWWGGGWGWNKPWWGGGWGWNKPWWGGGWGGWGRW